VFSGEQVDQLKRAAALRALELVRDGMVLGLGSGSTADICLIELGKRVRDGLRVSGVPSSERTARLASQLGVPLTSLELHDRLDLTIDGADQVEPRGFNLLKGRGGALLREKLVARASDQEIIIADESKLVGRLGGDRSLPVEIVQFGWRQTARELERLGCRAALRLNGESPFVSDEGHYLLDCHFPPIDNPASLADAIKAIVGVIEHGLFIGLADLLIIGGQAGVRVLARDAGQARHAS
jgi:ribose 5-phosphate isomerase A